MRAGVVGIVVLLAGTANGGIEHTILHGVSVGRVKAWVSWVSPEQVPGLTSAKVQAAAESSLSQGAVHLKQGTGAGLFIGATAILGPSGDCVVYIDARLIEDAKLERNGLRVEASSWSGHAVVSGRSGDCAESTVKITRDVVDDFVEHYHAMNPGQTAK
jgi:hypothetical protein